MRPQDNWILYRSGLNVTDGITIAIDVTSKGIGIESDIKISCGTRYALLPE